MSTLLLIRHHADLGCQGGGSTFAVMLSVTVRAYPVLPLSVMVWSYNTTANSDTYWSMLANFHNQLPELSEAGGMGYYYMTPNNSATQSDPALRGMLSGVWLFPKQTETQMKAALEPLTDKILASVVTGADAIVPGNYTASLPNFITAWLVLSPAEAVSGGGKYDSRLGSRLLDRKALKTDSAGLATALRKANPIPSETFLGHVVAGKAVANPPGGIPGGSNSVLPAWRKAYNHLVLPRSWPVFNNTAKIFVTDQLRNVQVQALKDLAPDTGAYVNEADPTEQDWKETYWGSNYAKLLEIKREWDPKGVFWCKPCIGYDDGWVVQSALGIEGAVGQAEGRICKSK
jgi:hypothetical protein